jgi:DMSO/TMAO reductase YedYZ molybdopterin-dependent catalytic subunit
MLDTRTRQTVVVAFLAGVAGVAGSFAVAGTTLGFVAAPIAGWLARVAPGALVTASILFLGDLGELLVFAGGVALAVALFAALALLARTVGGQLGRPLVGPLLGALLAWAAGALLVDPVLALGAAVPVGVVLLVFDVSPRAPVGTDPTRRALLGAAAAVIGFSALSTVLGASRSPASGVGTDIPVDASPEVRSLLREAAAKSLPIEGLEPLVSTDFYQVDINAVDPDMAPEEWSLHLTGPGVERTIDYADLTAMESHEEFVTLRCVGESLNGEKMDNALWTVVPIAPLLEDVDLADTCCVMLRAEDGYYEEFPLAALRRGLLAYRMNGRPLPRRHGAPVRALIPGHWGEINVKWVSEIELLEEEMDGYWEKRGWHGTGPVNTVAKLHVVNHRDDGRIEVAGHAYAGTRGIERVEVSTDGGETWTDADRSEPLPGEDVWCHWAHVYDPPAGTHEVVVRATDGTGTLQPSEEHRSFPSGATGWVREEVTP